MAAADPVDWDRVVRCAEQTGGYAAIGLHPWWVDAKASDWLSELSARRPALMGEVGLDFVCGVSQKLQVDVARRQLEMAVAWDVPVVLHCVRAWHVLGPMLRDVGNVRGMVHGWNGSAEQALDATKRGLYLSFGPTLLRSQKAMAAASALPQDQLLIETDCPDGAAEPADLLGVARAIGAARGMSTDEVLEVTRDNAQRLMR